MDFAVKVRFSPSIKADMLNQFETIIEPFAALSLIQLHQIMQLRQQVFMLEQQSLYLDADNNDVNATHEMVYDGAKLIAYARIVPPHLSIAYAQIGRVVVASAYREQGLGSAVLQAALETAQRQFPQLDVVIAAQTAQQAWYTGFGFVAEGEVFDDGGVEHVKMRLVHTA